jgi:hypothetical protein
MNGKPYVSRYLRKENY